MVGHHGQVYHFRLRPVGQFWNYLRRQAIFWRCFDDQRELRGGFREGHGGLWCGVLRAIDDVTPMNQIVERGGVEAEFFFRNVGDQFGAGLVIRLVKHIRSGVLTKVFRVRRRQEGALMMVEPPSYFRRVRIFEVHNHIFVAVKKAVCPRLYRAMGHAGQFELRLRIEALAVKTVKKRGRSGAIKTAIMETQAYSGHKPGECLSRLSAMLNEAFYNGGSQRESQ